jgi:hypothetical protein
MVARLECVKGATHGFVRPVTATFQVVEGKGKLATKVQVEVLGC